jgi:Ca2+-binding RTX toxin-like protein
MNTFARPETKRTFKTAAANDIDGLDTTVKFGIQTADTKEAGAPAVSGGGRPQVKNHQSNVIRSVRHARNNSLFDADHIVAGSIAAALTLDAAYAHGHGDAKANLKESDGGVADKDQDRLLSETLGQTPVPHLATDPDITFHYAGGVSRDTADDSDSNGTNLAGTDDNGKAVTDSGTDSGSVRVVGSHVGLIGQVDPGGSHDSTLYGSDNNDILYASARFTAIDGGDGTDTVVLRGDPLDYAYALDPLDQLVVSSTARDSHSLTLKHIEALAYEPAAAAGKAASGISGPDHSVANGQAPDGWMNAFLLSIGTSKADTIVATDARQFMLGGAGADVFYFNSTHAAGNSAGARDIIVDFDQGHDKIDLSVIDADESTPTIPMFVWDAANDTFVWDGQTDSGIHDVGHLGYHYEQYGDRWETIVEGNTNDNTEGHDFQIAVFGKFEMSEHDFML